MQQQAAPVPPTVVTAPGDGLRFQRCTWCRSAQPRTVLVCRVCRSESFRWERSTGLGRVVISPPSTRKPDTPPRPSTVQLDEGPLVDGWILGGPHEQWAGARVRFSATEDASGRPVFELAWAD